MNHEIIGPENRMIGRREALSISMPGQLRIPQNIAIENHIAQFWNPQNHPDYQEPPKTEKELLIELKKRNIWMLQREREESRTGIVQMEQEALTLAEGGRIPVIKRAEWPWKKDSTIQVDKDGNLYELRPVEHVKKVGSSAWELGDSQIGKR